MKNETVIMVVAIICSLAFISLGYMIGINYTKKNFQDKAIEAGVGKMVITTPNSRTTEFVFITNNITLP